jgi:hypothetical protein
MGKGGRLVGEGGRGEGAMGISADGVGSFCWI